MKKLARRLSTLCIAGALVLPSIASATNGLFLIGYGTKSRGMGGVAIAMPQDGVAAGVNPAAIGFIEDRFDMGGDYFAPRANVELGGLDEDSRANTFVMPAMGGVYKFNRKMTIGFAAIPAGGGGSRYNVNLFNNLTSADTTETLGVNLMVMQMAPSLSYRINKRNRIGASLVVGVQTFRAFGLDYFSTFTPDFETTGVFPTRLTNNGNDWAYGAGVRLGWMGRYFKERLSIGAVYTSRVAMTKFEKYSDLFAEGGSFDTPENYGIGMALKITPKLTVAADITRTLYSSVNAVSNAGPNSGGSPFPVDKQTNGLGAVEGLGFGWNDRNVYKLGVMYKHNSKWDFRAGWNYSESPIDETNGEILFNLVAPAVTQHHATVGASYRPSKRVEWSFSYVHAFEYEQAGPTLIGGTGTLKMYQNSVGVSFGYKL